MLCSAKIIHLLPKIELVEVLFAKNQYNELTIFKICFESISEETIKTIRPKSKMLVGALKDRLYEVINTGHWSQVDDLHRKAYTLATFFDVFFMIQRPECDVSESIIESVFYELDLGLLLGCPMDSERSILSETLSILSDIFVKNDISPKRAKIEESARHPDEHCDIPVLVRPTLVAFRTNHFTAKRPALLLDCISHWPAMQKWHNPNYLASIAGNRTVPIEVGSHYTNDEWSQDLVKFREFLARQIDPTESCDRIEYLAQHNLFDQIPALRSDLSIPEYCCISTTESNHPSSNPDIKAWLGPKGTVSPMHHDPKHNLLCQVFGHKQVILAAPEDSGNLYAHDDRMLSNTSRVDAESLDLELFPLAGNVRWYRFALYRGEMLYIPPGWWHHIRSLDKSFSVSFWWE